jgi:hypothetical protein
MKEGPKEERKRRRIAGRKRRTRAGRKRRRQR